MKKITIESYWSDMDYRDNDGDNVEGYYRVNVPKKHENDYLDVISWAGCFLDAIRFEDVDDKESAEEWIDDHEVKGLTKKFFIDNLDLALGWAEEGSNLDSTLAFLNKSKGERGWGYESLCYCRGGADHCYNADYTHFDW